MSDFDADLDDEFRFLPGDAERVGRAAPLPAVERRWAEADGGRRVSALAYEPDRAPETVLLHGVGLNAHSFDPMVLALGDRAGGAPALALDLPGHGRSDWREDADYSPAALAADTAPALAALAPAPFSLVGHSLGGLTAMGLASARPELVRRLVIVDISPGLRLRRDAGAIADFIMGRRSYETQDQIVERAIEFGIGRDRRALARGVALNTRRRPDGLWEWTHHFAHLDALPGETADEQPYAPLWSALETAYEAGVPIALVRAESGMLDDGLVAEWRDRLPGGRIVSVPGPHNLHEASPVELATALRGLGV